MNKISINKKGMSITQVFTFILAGLIFVLILIFGYNAISDLLQSSSDITVAELKSDLESSISSVKRSYGSVRKVELRAPNDFDEICFFDFNKCSDLYNVKSDKGILLNWAVDSCKFNSSNVFSIPRLVDLSIRTIEVNEGYVCIPKQGGSFTLKVTGKGNAVEIGKWDV